MKRRAVSFLLVLALCLNLFPVAAFAAGVGTGNGLCAHHPAHTDLCGYAAPVLGQECTHSHNDGCYIAQTNCVHTHTARCYPDPGDADGTGEPSLCAHTCTQDSGCVVQTLSCPHEHDGVCGYVPENPGAPCAFVCPVCPIEALIRELPSSVSAHNAEQVQAQLSEIYALYEELASGEQQQVDLSPCAALLDQIDGMDSEVLSGGSGSLEGDFILQEDKGLSAPFLANKAMTINTNGHTLTVLSGNAIQITGAGALTIINGGAVVSKTGAGVEIQSGGSLTIAAPGTSIRGQTYGLDVASGAEAHLSAGTYFGKQAAIRTEDGDFSALLEPGYTYFDASGNPILLDGMADAMEVTVGQCTDHTKTYAPNAGAATHTWTCSACKITGTEKCTFDFGQGITSTCDLCGNRISIAVDRDSLKELAYDSTVQPANGAVMVTAGDPAAELKAGDDYTVSYTTRAETGSTDVTVTVTVTGTTYNGTFTKDYTFTEDELTQPVLQWNDTSVVPVPYTGSPVTKDQLPGVTINITTASGVDLHDQLKYSYKAQGSGNAYTVGLPTNAGTYDIVVTLPEGPDYQAASSEAITLEINPIDPIVTAPAAASLTYNGSTQELITAGVLDPAAVADGLEIQFSVNESGPYSTAIPTGTNAGTSYSVWYKVVGLTGNYIGPNPNPVKIDGVEIRRKPITPMVTLSQYSYQYDNEYKQPAVTVKDTSVTPAVVLPDTEYTVEYDNNRDVSTPGNPAKAIVTDKTGGNYDIARVEAEFQITSRTQEALSITQKPNTVTYGGQFTLSTSGGSGNGLVTWEIIADGGEYVAKVGKDSGNVTIIGHGKATVKATKSGEDPESGLVNYEDATATWTLTADKKAVTATVTAEDKDYDGDDEAIVHAVVEQGVLAGDVINIQGLTGTFDSENAGVGITVTVDTSTASITGTNSEHYDVSYSSTTVKATIRKAVAKITTAPVPAALTYDGTAQALIAAGAVVDPADVQVEYALSEDGPYTTDFPKGTNAGTYTVWYRVQETNNYTGLAPASINVTISKKEVTASITLSQNSYIYDGSPKEPVVTLNDENGNLIPAEEYTVTYSGNVNVGTATVTATAKPDGNYAFVNGPVKETFEIQKEKAKVITAPEAAGLPLTFNTFDQRLVTAGAASGGTMVYSVDDENGTYSADIPVKTNAAKYTVYYKVEGDANHSDSDVGHVEVTIAPKMVKDPTITLFDENGDPLVSYTYDGKAKEPTVTVVDGSTTIDAGEYEIRYVNNVDAGNTATVNIIDKPNGNYTVTGSETFVIEKADITFNPAPSAATITYDGKPHELLDPGVTSGGTVQYALNSATATYRDAIPTATEAGKYTVYYKVVGDKNHNDLAVQSVNVTIERKPLTDITIELTPDSFEYDGKVKMPTVTVKFTEGKTETVVPKTEYDWTCSDSTPTNQGTYTITITDASGGNYDLTRVTVNTATFSIGKTAQAPLEITDKPAATIYGDTFTLTTSGGSSSSAVTWSVTGTAAAVDAATGAVKITGVGEVTVTATNPGDGNYLPVSDQWTFTAAPKPVTASVVVDDKNYDGTTNAAVTSASIATINGDTVTIDPDSITAAFDTPGVGTGKTVTLDVSKVQVTGADAAKYAISYPGTVSADITQATTTITTAPAKIDPLTYNGQPQALVTAGQTNVGFLVYSLDGTSFSSEVPTGTNAGTYTVYYKVDGTADYTGVAVNNPPISVTISPKPVTPKIDPSEFSFLYDGAKKEPELTVLDGKTVIDPDQYTVTWKNDDTTVTDGLLTAAGNYTATITNVPNGNYSFTAKATAEITAATQGALKITGKPEHVYYGDNVTTLEATGGSGNGTVKWSIESDDTNVTIAEATGILTVKGTGTFTVTAERAVPNYAPATDTWTFTVEPKPVTAEVTITAKNYDGTTDVDNTDITAAVKAGDLVNSADSVTISGLTGAYENANAGTGKTVTLNTSNAQAAGTDAAKYAVSYPATAKGDINPRQVTVTVTLSDHDLKTNSSATPPYFYNYDGTEKTPNVTVTANDDNAALAASDYSVSYANNKNVSTNDVKGAVTVTAEAGGNYTFADVEVQFDIRKAGAVLTSSPQAKILTYDGTAQELVTVGTAAGGTVVYSRTGVDGSYSEAIPKETAAGTYTVYYMVKGDANHADTAAAQVSVTIKPNEISPAITLSGDGLTETNGVYSYEYDGKPKTPTVTVKDGNDEISDDEYSVSYRDNTNAGTATVTVSNKNGGNYIVNGTATFEITKKAPTFTPPEAITGLQYNGALQELVKAGVSSEGAMVYSVNGGNYSSAIPVGTAVGSYTISYKVLGDANHSDTEPVELTVSIGKNEVTNPTISLSSDRFQYNGSQQKPTITVYDGHSRVIPEHEYTAAITGTNGNVGMVNVDTYTVTIAAAANSNYEFHGNLTRTFEIVPADQEAISITGTKAQVHYGDTIQLSATGGTGDGTITWNATATGGGTIGSTISGAGLLTVKDVNTSITVTVTRSKGGNYGDVSATWEFTAGKKPVTVVLTGVDRNYAAGDKTATVHASVPNSELVSGDSITISGLSGMFDSDSVGTDKKVTVDCTNLNISGDNSDKYTVTIPETTTASILAAAATVDTAPTPASTLIYDASTQELVSEGTATGGIMVYSLDGVNFTQAIPKVKDADTYTVYYKAQGDGNHTDSEVKSVQVTINKQTVASGDVQIELTPPSAQYDGNVKRPEVVVRDKANNVIPESEYKTTYVSDNGENWTDQGTYKVKVENITGGNYVVETATADFVISTTEQNPLEIVNKPGLVHYGDTFTLSAVGGSGNKQVTWESSNETIAHIDANGLVTIKGVGSATITATKPGGSNYDTATATYPLNALQKPVTAIFTADDKVYNGNTDATVHVTWEKGALVGDDEIKIGTLSGIFEDEQVGTNKKVTVTCTFVNDTTSQKYDITVPPGTTASILKADATAPNLTANDRVYDGAAQPLVSGGTANTTLYSNSKDGVYSATIPTGTNAGTYTVWYKTKGDDNHNDSQPQSIQVTISRKTLTADATNVTLSGSDLQTGTDGTHYYTYDGTEKQPSVIVKDGSAVIPASEYTVSYSNNKNVSTDDQKATVTITSSDGGNYIVSGSVTFEIRKGGAQLTGSPQAKDLTYTGLEQELVTVGSATGGHIEYKLDGSTDDFGAEIPKAADAGSYVVHYKVVGDGNHADGEAGSVTVTIKPKEVISPKVTVTGTYTYDGNAKEPGVTVEDGTTLIPSTEYTLSYRDNVNAGTATVIITNANGGNYIVNGTGTFEIAEGTASVATAPKGLENLPYNGAEQALIEAGAASNGTMVYSLTQDGPYTPAIPTGKAVGSYSVWYKVQGDGNHSDSTPASVNASIIANAVTNPTIQVTPPTVTFNGEKQEPTVTVKDDKGFVIDGSEYTVTYQDKDGNSTTDLTAVGKYTLTITGVTGGNYTFDGTDDKNTATFEILPADQKPLTITGTRERVYYGDTIQLGTSGGNGQVTWSVGGSTIASINNGLLKITGVGQVTVTATSTKPGYADQTVTWALYAEQKPVTAVVTAAAKTYDGNTNATVTAALNTSDLVAGDVVKITLAGSFEDPNAGTDKKVNVDSTNPKFSTDSVGQGNYLITYPATATASIFKADIDTTDPAKVTPPTAAVGLTYTGLPLTLVDTAGSSTEGTMEYSLDGKTYSASLPTGANAGSYDVWYRVKGDGNHNDTAGKELGTVTIAPQTVTAPIIEFNPSGASYDGKEHKPTVTVKDSNNRVIPETEYTVDFGTGDWTKAGDYEVKVTDKDGGNYAFAEAKKTFTILVAGQSPLSITNKPGKVQYGDSFTLSAVGGSITGAVAWESSDPLTASIDDSGLVTVHKSGSVTITAKKVADGNYGEVSDTWSFNAEKKPVTAVVTAKDKVYDTTDEAKLVITWKDGDLLENDSIPLNLTGKFDNAGVGTNKTVTISGAKPDNEKYAVNYNETTTASITPAAATVIAPTPLNVVYSGQPEALVSAGISTNGTISYSLDGIVYGPNIPKGTAAGSYTVWYKVTGNENYKDIAPAVVPVTIAPRTVTDPIIDLSPETFDYDGMPKKPDVVVKDGTVVIPSGEYTVSYSNNVNVGTSATVTISDNDGGNYTVNGTASFTIKAGNAVLKEAPQPKDLTYRGFEQELVTPGTAENGQVVYSATKNGTYGTSIPVGTDAGVYQVWYKVQGSNGASGTEPRQLLVEIKPNPVTATITLTLASDPVPYTGLPIKPPVTVNVEGKTLSAGEYTTTYSNNINAGTATVSVQSVGGNYQFNASTTFEIAKAKATFEVDPEGKTGLVYTGEPQELIEELTGLSLDGIVVYSQDTMTYSAEIPTGTKVRTYTIFAKVLGNATHEDSDIKTIKVSIGKNAVSNPSVTLSQGSFSYTGGAHTPTVTVADDKGNVIPASEYDVAYSDNVEVGQATVTITSKGTNYSFTATAHFQITGADQPALTITGKKDTVCYGDTLYLGATGGSGTGTVTWTTSNADIAAIDENGVATIKKSGSVTITATKAASGGYAEAADTWTFYAKPKPVTAVVTAASKPFDGNNTATLAVTISNGLVPGDSITTNTEDGVKAAGHFADVNVGENKTVVIDGLTVPDAVSEKYDISWPATTTASITPKPASVTKVPEAVTGPLTYNGSQQALVTPGTADDGNMMYSLDGRDYSYNLPTAADAGSYTVWYKAAATDGNHMDSTPVRMSPVTISANKDTPTVQCSPSAIQYDSTEKTPTVTVTDSEGCIIPESEYTVELPSPRIEVGKYTVTVTDKPGGNYEFSSPVVVTDAFEIVARGQNPLTITDKPANVRYGDTFNLSATGGSGSGAINWSIAEGGGATIDGNGRVTVTGVGPFTVTAFREAADGYNQSNTDSVLFEAKAKPVTPVVTIKPKDYDGNINVAADAITVTVRPGDLVSGDSITISGLEAVYDSVNAGTNKAVMLNHSNAAIVGDHSDRYVINWPDSVTGTIDRVDAKLATAPAGKTLSYNGNPQDLVSAGSTENNIGTVVYSTSQNGVYSAAIPTGINAGKYAVWYKVADSVNYTGIAPASIEVEITKATPTISTYPTASGAAGQQLKDIRLDGGATDTTGGVFVWENPETTAVAGMKYNVIFKPNDEVNYSTVTIQVLAAANSAGGGTDSSGGSTPPTATDDTPSADTSYTPTRTTIQNGTATTVLSASDGNQLVKEAVKSQSGTIVIKPEITSGVSKTQVSIPASTVSQIQRETSAALTVSTPIADATIPHEALSILSRAGGSVQVAAEQVGQSVVLTLSADGQPVENVPGGVTLTVPAENAGPGTVAVLVHEDGAREIVPRSVVKDGKVTAQLSGSATVEIVDNSKTFADVRPTDWAAEAVSFASARQLFNGTSETTFSPEGTTSRGMVATVLYRLEGQPDQAPASAYNDVSGDAWYADSIAWAAENGIVNGYGDGTFGPNDSVTREQFVVMLWRYLGSPEAKGSGLDAFTDADQINGYAVEALCWAVENGVLNGNGNGKLVPGGTATRAEAAQMLKNFMENT